MPGYFPQSNTGGRSQSVRFIHSRRSVAPGGPRYAHYERQVLDSHRPGARRIRPSYRFAEAAHANDGEAEEEASGISYDAADAKNLWSARGECAAGWVGFDAGTSP